MTIDELAVASQQEFDIIHKDIADIRGTMVTRSEFDAAMIKIEKRFDAMERTIKETRLELRTLIERLASQLLAFAVRTSEDIASLRAADRDMDIRLRALEHKSALP